MALCRRFLLILSLLFWQGGFMFYGGVVVPVGGRILGSETEQGFITQSVTNYLNLAGAVCLLTWGLVLWIDRPHAPRLRVASWTLWVGLVSGLAVLALVHLRMERLLDFESRSVLEQDHFGWLHGAYIATSSAQWLASLILLGLTLRSWQIADARLQAIPAA
jgi:hypothetical protein